MIFFLTFSAHLICAWAEEGADTMGPNGLFHSNAFPPKKLVDTLGAGDTFNAAVIFELHNGRSEFVVLSQNQASF